MLQILKKLNVLLDKKQKRTMVWLTFMMVIGAALQTAGVGMILPVVSLVMNKEALYEEGLLHDMFLLIGGGSEIRFTVLVMVALILVFVVKNATDVPYYLIEDYSDKKYKPNPPKKERLYMHFTSIPG